MWISAELGDDSKHSLFSRHVSEVLMKTVYSVMLTCSLNTDCSQQGGFSRLWQKIRRELVHMEKVWTGSCNMNSSCCSGEAMSVEGLQTCCYIFYHYSCNGNLVAVTVRWWPSLWSELHWQNRLQTGFEPETNTVVWSHFFLPVSLSLCTLEDSCCLPEKWLIKTDLCGDTADSETIRPSL